MCWTVGQVFGVSFCFSDCRRLFFLLAEYSMAKRGRGLPNIKYNAEDETARGRKRQTFLFFRFARNIIKGFDYGGCDTLQPFDGPDEWVKIGPYLTAKNMEAHAKNMRLMTFIINTPWVDCVKSDTLVYIRT